MDFQTINTDPTPIEKRREQFDNELEQKAELQSAFSLEISHEADSVFSSGGANTSTLVVADFGNIRILCTHCIFVRRGL